MSEGLRAVETDDALLRQSNLHFKRRNTDAVNPSHQGELPYPVDLRRNGSSIQILGHKLRLVDGSIKFDLGCKSLQKLSMALGRAHSLPDSFHIAQQMLNGWISEYGAAFESYGVERYLNGIANVLSMNDFHELICMDQLMPASLRAVQQWTVVREHSVRDFLRGGNVVRAPQRSPRS